jgi:hypothetical protein
MITLRINSQAHLGPLSELPGQAATPIRDRLSFPNPAHQAAEKRGFYNGNIPQEINKRFMTTWTPWGFLRTRPGQGNGFMRGNDEHQREDRPEQPGGWLGRPMPLGRGGLKGVHPLIPK